MNLSSRWCVTAVVAFGGVACSDPVPPPAQGAFIANVYSVSPPVANKTCPSGAALTYEVPTVPIPTTEHPANEALDADTYLHKIIDGEDSSDVKCSVKSGSAISFEGHIILGGKGLEISGGSLPDKKSGTARISFTKTSNPGFSHQLSSPPGGCTVEAVVGAKGEIQAKAGSMWAHYSCAGIDDDFTGNCRSEGYFVLENCDQ